MKKIVKLAVIIAVLIFAASGIFLKAVVGKEKVVVLNDNIAAGTIITENMLSQKDIPVLARIPGSVVKADILIGKTLLVPRYKNDQVGSEMIGDKKVEIEDGQGLITLNVSKEEAGNIKAGASISIITYQANGETKEVTGFNVVKMNTGVSQVSGHEESILTLLNQTKANESVAPYIRSGNYKVEVVGG